MSNPQSQKPWKAEYAKSARSSCRTCKSPIASEKLRLGKMVQSTKFDGLMPMWNHADCILKKANQIKSIDDVENIELLRWEDQQNIRKYIESGGPPKSNAVKNVKNTECGIEVSQTSRATCKHCGQKIIKGEVRISTKPDGQGARGLAWHHAKCLMELSPSIQVDKLSGWNSLSSSDQSAVSDLAMKGHSMNKGGGSGTNVEAEEVKESTQQSSSKGGKKRGKDAGGEQKSKAAKVKGDVSVGRAVAMKNADDSGEACDLENRLEAQSKELWALKDDLKKHVTTAELREMLEANGQDSTGSELDLRDRCADGMMFGAVGHCPLCSGFLRYSGGMYRCSGFISEWSKCSYSTCEPKRAEGKWKIPKETDNQYLKKWFKSQKGKKPVRILPPPSSRTSAETQITASQHQSSNSESLGDLKVSISGLPKDSIEEWKHKIDGIGGVFHAKVKKDTNCLVVSGALNDEAEMRKARRMKIPIVREDYLVDCIERKKKLPFDMYKVEMIGEASSMVTIKVKGHSAVHEASGLQDSGHILEEGKSIYNTTLNMSDLSSGINRIEGITQPRRAPRSHSSLTTSISSEMEKFLCELLLDSTQPISERFRALFSLRNLKGPAPRSALILATRDSSNLLAHEAAFALGQMQELEAIPALASVLNDLSLHPIVRHEAAEALGAIGSDSNLPLLKNSLDSDPAQEVRETCELALQRIQHLKHAANTDDLSATDISPFKSVDPAAAATSCSSVDQLREVLLDEEKGMYERYAALFALRNDGGNEAVAAIIDSLGSKSALLKHEVAYVLGQLQDKAASAALSDILRDVNEHPMVRHEAAEALGSIADDQSVALLEEFTADPEPLVSQSCQVALSMLEFERSGKSFEFLFMRAPIVH